MKDRLFTAPVVLCAVSQQRPDPALPALPVGGKLWFFRAREGGATAGRPADERGRRDEKRPAAWRAAGRRGARGALTLFSRMGEEAGTWQTPARLRAAESIGMGSILIALGRHAYACGPRPLVGRSFLPPGRGFLPRRIPGRNGWHPNREGRCALSPAPCSARRRKGRKQGLQ